MAPAPPKAKPKLKAPRTIAPKAPPTGAKEPTRKKKSFSITPWTGEGEGEKILLYGPSGIGKTTLAALAPDPVFIGVDDGGRKIRRPDGSPVNAINGIEDFLDLRDAINQPLVWKDSQTIVFDTLTRVESSWVIPHLLANVKTEKGAKVKSIEGYGWNKGYTHMLEHMRLLLMDLDLLVRAGKTILFICQEEAISVANAEGLDYLQDGPKLIHRKNASTRLEVTEWCDHVLRIGFYDTAVTGDADSRVGKVATDDTTRVVYASQARHFIAKSRSLNEEIISFADPSDDSLWKIMFAK